jgi:hypothetical protein
MRLTEQKNTILKSVTAKQSPTFSRFDKFNKNIITNGHGRSEGDHPVRRTIMRKRVTMRE